MHLAKSDFGESGWAQSDEIKKMWAALWLVSLVWLVVVPARASDGDANRAAALAGVQLTEMKPAADQYVQQTEDGRTIVFTVDANLQAFANGLLERYRVPEGAVVLMNSRTGRVLALSQRYARSQHLACSDVALNAEPPAASIFKIITTAALLESEAIQLDSKMCYHGGGQSLQQCHLEDSKEQDKACGTLASALGHSTNAIFAKFSDRHLSPEQLLRTSERFGFNRDIPFEIDVPISRFDMPLGRLERARASAGFWHSHISPIHGALIAQAIAQKGAMLRPYVVDHVQDAAGETIYRSSAKFWHRAVSREVSEQLIAAMARTVTHGTAKSAFYDKRGVPVVPTSVAGKTGTLNGANPFRAYTWFVGLAPVENPEVAISVLIANDPEWHIKASWTAAQVLRKYFELKKVKSS